MKSQRAPYAIVSDETWELVRGAYLSGLSATVVAARFGVTVWGLRKRATKHGWTKMAYAKARGAPLAAADPSAGDGDGDEPTFDPAMVLQATLQRAGRALMKGEGIEAQALVRAAEGYMRLNAAIRQVGPDANGAEGGSPQRAAAIDFIRRRMHELRIKAGEIDPDTPFIEDED